MKELTPQEVNNILVSGKFDQLKGAVEHEQMECKGALYHFSTEANKLELAKDVSAFANSKGGILLLGVTTLKDPTHRHEVITEIRCFGQNKFDIDQYRQTLNSWIYPPIRSLEIRWHPSGDNPEAGLASITVGADCGNEKPYLLVKSEIDKRISTKLVGYFERVEDSTATISAQEFRERFKDGTRFEELERRLEDIQRVLAQQASDSAVKKNEAGTEQLIQRMAKTREAAGLAEEPVFNLGASPLESVEFANLFASDESPEVKLFNKLPEYRAFGFDLNTGDRADIVQAELRRRVAAGKAAVDLWKDGTLTVSGTAGDRLLGWAVQREADDNNIAINNIALVEIVCLFFRACVGLYQYAQPVPQRIKVLAELIGDSKREKTYRLSSANLSMQRAYVFEWRSAPEPSGRFTADFDLKNTIPEVEALKLIRSIYNWFGFADNEVPYVDRKSVPQRIDPKLFSMN